MLVENKFGTGLVPDIEKDTDYVFTGDEAFDWNEGFDIEDKIKRELGVATYKLKPNNQKRSLSCVGQGWDKYGEVKYLLYEKNEINFSPRWIYSNIHLPNGGARIYSGGAWVRDHGLLPDNIFPSEPMTEDHLRDKGVYKDGIGNDYELWQQLFSKGKLFSVWRTMDLFAKAIRDNDGLVFGVVGNNNGTWRSEFPQPPESINDVQWGHAIYAGRAKKINGKKYIGILNSWGENIGDRGWQWLDEDYINKTFAFTGWTWAPVLGEIKDLQLYKDIERYIKVNKIRWNKTSEWARVKEHFVTDLTRGHYYDYLQIKKYL